MTIEEFYKRYANTSLEQRMIPLNFAASGMMTLHEIYTQVENLENYLRPIRMQQQNLMDMADKFLNKHNENN